MNFSSSLSSNLLLSIHKEHVAAGLMPYISMEAKIDEQASKATLDRKRPTPIIARPIKALEEKIERLEEVRQICENVLTFLEQQKKMAKFARLQALLEVELLEDPDEDNQPRSNATGDGGRQLRSFRGFDQETRPPKRPRTETQDPVDTRRELLTNFANNDRLDGHEEADEKITVRVNQDGNLESDSEPDVQAWNELEDAWQDMKRQFDSKSSNWTSIGLKRKCVWGAVVSAPTTHYWTREQPGNFACRSCANKTRICVGWVGESLQLLPLPPVPESAKHTVTNLVSNYVAETENISRRALQVWH
ncbi:hypothetical protein KCV07_g4031, partial [Aureobasidium melanogenum]